MKKPFLFFVVLMLTALSAKAQFFEGVEASAVAQYPHQNSLRSGCGVTVPCLIFSENRF